MSARRSDRLIVAGLVLVLLGVAVFSFLSESAQAGQVELQGSSFSPAPPGTLALYRWLEDAGYPVRRIAGGTSFAAALRDTDLLFVLNPQTNFTPAQVATLQSWMLAGGVLVLSLEGSQGALNPLTGALGAGLTPLVPPLAGDLTPSQPVWTRPPVRRVGVQTSWQVDLPGADAVVLLAAGPSAVALTQPRGRGRLILLSTTWPFTNAGLQDQGSDNRWLAWNLAAAGPGARVAFDEVHHGYTAGALSDLLLSRPWGWALIYAAAVLVLGLLLAGRRLGPALAARAAGPRRGAADYVTALAGLFGRAGRTDWVAARYRSDFRRALAAASGLDPTAPAADLAAAFAAAQPQPVDPAALQTLLGALDAAAQPAARGRPAATDAALLRLVRQAEAFLSDQ